jgi:hypothetical protein
MEAGGERYMFTNKTLRYITANLAWFANLLATNRIGTNLLEEDKTRRRKRRGRINLKTQFSLAFPAFLSSGFRQRSKIY